MKLEEAAAKLMVELEYPAHKNPWGKVWLESKNRRIERMKKIIDFIKMELENE